MIVKQPSTCKSFVAIKPAVVLNKREVASAEKARREHVSGRANLLFHIVPDGSPTDIILITKRPPGYDFTKLIIKDLNKTRYAPNLNEKRWYAVARDF